MLKSTQKYKHRVENRDFFFFTLVCEFAHEQKVENRVFFPHIFEFAHEQKVWNICIIYHSLPSENWFFLQNRQSFKGKQKKLPLKVPRKISEKPFNSSPGKNYWMILMHVIQPPNSKLVLMKNKNYRHVTWEKFPWKKPYQKSLNFHSPATG